MRKLDYTFLQSSETGKKILVEVPDWIVEDTEIYTEFLLEIEELCEVIFDGPVSRLSKMELDILQQRELRKLHKLTSSVHIYHTGDWTVGISGDTVDIASNFVLSRENKTELRKFFADYFDFETFVQDGV